MLTDTDTEVSRMMTNLKTIEPGDRQYTFILYNGIQFVMVGWKTPTGIKIQFRVFKQIVSTLDEVKTRIDNYWNNNR